MELDFSSKTWFAFFSCILVFDAVLITWAFVNQFWILILLFVLTAVGGGYWLVTQWNIDERTEQALDDASRQTVSLFFILSLLIGSILVTIAYIVDSNDFYPIGATLVVSGIVLFYLQAILSVKREGEMR